MKTKSKRPKKRTAARGARFWDGRVGDSTEPVLGREPAMAMVGGEWQGCVQMEGFFWELSWMDTSGHRAF